MFQSDGDHVVYTLHLTGLTHRPRVHRAISNFKAWLRGTQRSVSNEHLQIYLDEFVFRYNRRRSPLPAFQTIFGLNRTKTPQPTAKSWRKAPARENEPDLTGYALAHYRQADGLASPHHGATGYMRSNLLGGLPVIR
ncbi:transposase [Paeniglutamicibacter antarcticus]|uniref:Transposase n=1 Tax=Arthrobacter terrae TaxID=2935737 RepID=A0A931CQF3_9MICC|nr:transposase [Arthrobacter terrae]